MDMDCHVKFLLFFLFCFCRALRGDTPLKPGPEGYVWMGLEITGVPLSNNSAGAAQQPTQWLYWTASRCDCVSGNRVFQSERVKLP